MRILVRQLKLQLDYTEADLLAAACARLKCAPGAVKSLTLERRSIDARTRWGRPFFIINAEVELSAPVTIEPGMDAVEVPEAPSAPLREQAPAFASSGAPPRPIVAGAGPAGLFAALALARAGLRPLVLERGKTAAERHPDVSAFWKKGKLSPESNVLFGEGGAGLYSDGKLTSRSKDSARQRAVLDTFVACGAEADILYDSRAHLGSDRVFTIVGKLREMICELGGEFRFGCRLDGLALEGRRLRGVRSGTQELEANALILACGHSARDVYKLLAENGVALAPKGFAVGVRAEMPQAAIDFSQYGEAAGHPRLGAAPFALTRKPGGGVRACYSFCMCPGGEVIACASGSGEILTNGMSMSARAGKFGNAAFLVPVEPEDFPSASPLAGFAFQEKIERAAFALGGKGYAVPAMALEDFLSGRDSAGLPEERSLARATAANLREILPGFVANTLTLALPPLLRQLRGVKLEEVLLYAPETRSSAPVRVARDEQGMSANTPGLFPAGEGSGYAGGIVSSAIDGIKAAEGALAFCAAR